MTHIQESRRFGRVWKLFQVLFLCTLLLPAAVGAADGRLVPSGEPVPVQASDSERSQEEWDRASESAVRDVQSAFDSIGGNGTANLALLIPILAVIFIFGGPVVVIVVIAVLYYRSKTRREQIRAETTLKALETGRELPKELLEEKPVDKAEDNLRKGVKNIGLGLGLVLGLSFLVGIELGALGFILVGIGGAQLALWKLDNRKSNDAT